MSVQTVTVHWVQGAVGGMLIGTLALLFVVPSLFIVFQYLQEKVRPIQFEPTHDWQIQEEVVEVTAERKDYLESKKKGNQADEK